MTFSCLVDEFAVNFLSISIPDISRSDSVQNHVVRLPNTNLGRI